MSTPCYATVKETRGSELLDRDEPDGLSSEFVRCLFEDREHNIWVGTQNGLNRFRDEKITTLTRSEGLVTEDVGALAAAPGGSVWASTSGGISRIDGEHRHLYLQGVSAMGCLSNGQIDSGREQRVESET